MKTIELGLKGHEAMQCVVSIINDGEEIILTSYKTVVVKAKKTEDGKYEIYPDGMFWDGERVYTPTTARHISYFLREYFSGLSYDAFKKSATNCSKYGIPVEKLTKEGGVIYG